MPPSGSPGTRPVLRRLASAAQVSRPRLDHEPAITSPESDQVVLVRELAVRELRHIRAQFLEPDESKPVIGERLVRRRRSARPLRAREPDRCRVARRPAVRAAVTLSRGLNRTERLFCSAPRGTAWSPHAGGPARNRVRRARDGLSGAAASRDGYGGACFVSGSARPPHATAYLPARASSSPRCSQRRRRFELLVRLVAARRDEKHEQKCMPDDRTALGHAVAVRERTWAD
jgi:hypothetical protein